GKSIQTGIDMMFPTLRWALGLAVSVAIVMKLAAVRAQEAAVPTAAPGGVRAVPIGPDGKPLARPTGAPAKETPAGNPAESKKPDAKKDESPASVQRPEKPPLPPDPRELKVDPNPEGKVRFSFHGQSWADVLEWLARISGMSLDWQELPGDYLNLVTQRAYTIPEARDLINRHLLARGYTLLEQGEILSVANIQKLNPGLVPRVEPAELASRLPHEYVKVSLPLDWLLSEKAVEELKPMLSPNAKLTPLKATNRIEAMDAVVNLREIYNLLQREQSPDSDQQLVREFPLQHTRAGEVLPQLQGLLGMDVKRPSGSRQGAAEQMEMMQQQMMMMMQRQGGNQPQPQPKKNEDIHLVANERQNSILANAPPDKMEIIAQAVKAIDVESDRAQSLLTNINRMQVYRMHTVDPDALVRTLFEIGELHPTTRLEVDAKNKSIIAYATLADHLTIRQVLERLDGSTRKFEVITLRRLEADYVAGTIEFMMTGPKEEKQQPRYYDFYYSPYRRSENGDKSDDKFRVDADVQNNRLLLWANELEIGEVTNLLVKLGEIPAAGGSRERIRVLDTVAPEDLQRLLERLRGAWPGLAPNPLQLPRVPPLLGEPDGRAPATSPSAEPAESPVESSSRFKEARRHRLTPSNPARDDAGHSVAWLAAADARAEADTTRDTHLAQAPSGSELRPEDPPRGSVAAGDASPGTTSPSSQSSGELPDAAATPPVGVILSPDGRLVITSDDTRALDLLEELIAQLAPPRRDFHVFKLKHADSYYVSKNLEEFFELDSSSKSPSNARVYYYYDSFSQDRNKEEPSYRLSQRRKLKFIDDYDTNSILVQGADAEQLQIIRDLISTYDQAQQADASSARLTASFPIRYSRAQTIADAIKDVYRDLLSSNDKALQNSNANPEQRNRQASGTTYIFNEGGESGDEKDRTRVTFKGKLSLGVDDVTNTLLVSAEGEILMRNVTEMVQAMDEAARPLSSVSVLRVQGNTNASRVREVLGRMLLEQKTVTPGQKNGPPGTPAGTPGNEGNASGSSAPAASP
ncbi:MAG: secretin N-terminal domain-containing protein, partial [Pirellulaceae bacterium]